MIIHTPQLARRLFWDACFNIRDLGGFLTRDGTQTRWRSFVRADTLCRLTANGRAAPLLALAGVPYSTIAEDYALSAVCLQPIYDEQLRQEPDSARRERMAAWMTTAPETMLAILAHLDAVHGGVERCLLRNIPDPDPLH